MHELWRILSVQPLSVKTEHFVSQKWDDGTISQTIQMVFFDLESVALRLDLMSSRKPIRLIFIYLLCMVRYTINEKMGPSGLFYSFVVTLRSYRSHLRSFLGHFEVIWGCFANNFIPHCWFRRILKIPMKIWDEHSSVIKLTLLNSV